MASEDSPRPPKREIPLDVRELAPGVRRFTVPLPFPSPDHLHVHVLDTPDGQLLVDCGAHGSEAALHDGLAALAADWKQLLITHAHVDHWGIATTLTDRVLAHPGVRGTFEMMAAWASGSAEPDAMQEAVNEAFADMGKLISGIPEVDPVHDGDRIGDWEVLFTPGHDPGHICLYRRDDGVLLCGDVLLPGYTPNIQPAPGSDALGDFLASVKRLGELPISLVLPSHGEPYHDAPERARELLAHHQKRLEKLRSEMADGTTSLRDLRNATFSLGDGSRGDRMLAAMETFAHLEHLRLKGEAQMAADGSWSPVA
jgi:glyoxylase-like metal-dependent hydrolase (beta-lactamase superfamily II)